MQRYQLAVYPITFPPVDGARIPDDIPVLLEVCRSFGGQGIIDYPR